MVDISPPDNELLAKKFNRNAPDPKFPKDFEKRGRKYGRGLTIIWADQCPYVGKSLSEIIETAKKRGIKMRKIELRSARDAQSAPTPYAVFSIIYDNRVVADHMVSNTRFKNILKEIGL